MSNRDAIENKQNREAKHAYAKPTLVEYGQMRKLTLHPSGKGKGKGKGDD